MKKTLIIAIVIFAVVIGGIGWYGYSAFHARYGAEAPPTDTVPEREGGREEESDGSWTDRLPSVWNTGEEAEQAATTDETETPPDTEPVPTVERDADIPVVDIDTASRDGDEEGAMANVTNTHCETGCEAFAGDFAYLEYCRQVCGLEEPQNVTPADCESLESIRRDYCLKDAAIIANNAALCDGIGDTNIRTTCETRVTENFLEGP